MSKGVIISYMVKKYGPQINQIHPNSFSILDYLFLEIYISSPKFFELKGKLNCQGNVNLKPLFEKCLFPNETKIF